MKLALLLLIATAQGMNIYSMIDGVNINLNDYIEVQNYNEAKLQVVDDKTALNQILTIDIVRIHSVLIIHRQLLT